MSPSNASISRREYLYPLPHPLPPGTPVPYSTGLPAVNPLNLPPHPVEPTHTLVLTSTRKQFVDIRVFKPILPEDPELPNEGAPEDIPPDTGTMYPISPTQTLEFGSAINPATGRMHSYEEFWTDVAIKATPSLADPDPPIWSVVLRLDEPEQDVRGCIVRLGQYCQGIVMKGSYVTVERWEFSVGEGEKEGDWKRTVRMGDQFLPLCAVAFGPGFGGGRAGTVLGLSVGGGGAGWLEGGE
ncbi:hypothetical protein N0V90_001047 [Kalmusia sp. IMI 367209]|nr:hypothetical protein N0V90_001047 [Kalmusia sp. IMI 367209]